ncbi:MAG: shikimate kinase [Roseburia sp.]
MKNIYLIGFMGVGKSTIAKELAYITGAQRVEMDEVIERQQEMTIAEIFEIYGEERFRDLETELLRSFKGQENLIISCGGGSVLRDENAALMKQSGFIVFLTAEPETVYERVKNSAKRPILNGNMSVTFIRELMEKRRARYETLADIHVQTDGKDTLSICREVLRQVG